MEEYCRESSCPEQCIAPLFIGCNENCVQLTTTTTTRIPFTTTTTSTSSTTTTTTTFPRTTTTSTSTTSTTSTSTTSTSTTSTTSTSTSSSSTTTTTTTFKGREKLTIQFKGILSPGGTASVNNLNTTSIAIPIATDYYNGSVSVFVATESIVYNGLLLASQTSLLIEQLSDANIPVEIFYSKNSGTTFNLLDSFTLNQFQSYSAVYNTSENGLGFNNILEIRVTE